MLQARRQLAWTMALGWVLLACGGAEDRSALDYQDGPSGADAGTRATESAVPPPAVNSAGAVCDAIGITQSCYMGEAANAGVGECVSGEQTCEPHGEFAMWSACVGSQAPRDETCGNGRDEDCDGAIDEDCGTCAPGRTRPCGDLDASEINVGMCRQGIQTCLDDGSAYGECEGVVFPAREACGGGDEDCDGTTDEGCGDEPTGDDCERRDGTCRDEPSGTPPPEDECWSAPFMHEGCRPVSTSWYEAGGCPWSVCKTEADPTRSACSSGNSSINGVWGEDCTDCRTPPCRMYRTTVQNCSPAGCRVF